MNYHTLTKDELTEQLSLLEGWYMQDAKLCKDFKFPDFLHALAFINAVATRAQILDHHPEWTNIYNKVSVRLYTHDAGDAITNLDVELARAMEEVATN